LITADASCSNWGPEPYTKKLPKDAWQREFQYSAEGAGFVIKSLGADGKEGGDGNSKDISSEDIQ
jgi:general secretion pathway protein G